MAPRLILTPGDAEGFDGGLWKSNIWSPLRRFRYCIREYLAEFIGTFVLYFAGSGVCVINSGLDDGGDWLLIAMGWGLAVMLGVYTAAGVSGAHLNPAVTLSMATFNGFEWTKVPLFWLAQVLGAYFAGLVNIGLNLPILKRLNRMGLEPGITKPGILLADPEHKFLDRGNDTSGNFCTWPDPDISHGRAFATEVCLTALLLFGIYAITNNRNPAANPQGMNGLLVGLLVVLIGACWGKTTGYAINPARDFGPRLAMVSAGYNKEVFTAYNHYFWIPIVAPLVGGLLGGVVYFSLIDHKVFFKDVVEAHSIEESEDEDSGGKPL